MRNAASFAVLALCVCLGTLTQAAFLSNQLPLKVLSILPDQSTICCRTSITVVFSRPVIALGSDWDGPLSESQVPFLLMHGNQKLNIPGKLRWVTTAIARFDPDTDWPTDLKFEASLNPALKSYDGLTPAEAKSMSYNTQGLSASISSVTSVTAMALTDKIWGPFTATIEPSAPEVPPDGILSLYFSSPVDLSRLAGRIQLTDKDYKVIDGAEAWQMQTCDTEPIVITSASASKLSTCMQLVPRVQLEVDTVYALVIPAGTAYHALAGNLGADIALRFSGLLSFKFPFANYNPVIQYRRLDLWLRHGLGDAVQVSTLSAQLSLTPALTFTLTRPGKGYVRLSADFNPHVSYTLTVRASTAVVDGYGLALQAQTFTFQMGDLSPFFVEPDGYVVFESSQVPQLTSWQIFARGSTQGWYTPPTMKLIPVNAADPATMEAALSLATTRSGVASTLTPSTSVTVARNEELQVFSLALPPTPLFVRETVTGTGGWSSASLTALTDLMVAAVADSSAHIVVWVTRHSSGAAVVNARAALYRVDLTTRALTAVTSAMTAADGTALISLDASQPTQDAAQFWASPYQFAVLVTLGAEMAFVPSVTFPPSRASAATASLITDRALYKPGDTVYLKGYLRTLALDSVDWSLVDPSAAWSLTVVWKASEIGGQSAVQTVLDVVPSTQFGTFDAQFSIPSDASYGVKSIVLTTTSKSVDPSQSTVAVASITLADPRRPTTTMALTTPAKIYRLLPATATPRTAVALTAAVHTQSGLPVAHANVDLKWALYRGPDHADDLSGGGGSSSPGSGNGGGRGFGDTLLPGKGASVSAPNSPSAGGSSTESGLIALSTGTDGVASLNFNLEATVASAFPNAPAIKAGDSVTLEASYVGPTGELIVSSLSLSVMTSEYQLTVDTSVPDPLPGFPFSVYVKLQDTQGNMVNGKTVKVALYDYTVWKTAHASPASQITDTPISSCNANSDGGVIAQCEMTLPAPKRYLVEWSVQDTTGPVPVTVAVRRAFGQSASEWAVNPLSWYTGLSMRLDKAADAYAVGQQAKVSFYNPFSNALLLLRWGDQVNTGHQMQQQAVSVGWNAVGVALGPECTRGCRIMAVLAVPRQTTQPLLPVVLPVSALFDFGAPRILSEALTIVMPDRNRAVHAALTLDTPQEAYLPGASVAATVKITDPTTGAPVTGEVAVFVVDQAFLDLLPSPMPNLAEAFHIALPETFNGVDTAAFIGVKTGYDTVSTVNRRRLITDPWIQPSWPTQPNDMYYPAPDTDIRCVSGMDVDLSDERFLARYVAQLTQFPNYGYASPCGYQMFFASDGGIADFGDAEGGAPAPTAPGAGKMMSIGLAAEATAGGGSASGGGGNFPVRSQFETVPLFVGAALTDASGMAHITVELPGNIGRFSLRAYAVDGAHRFGASETLIATRRPLSLEAMLPRIARLGDVFYAGVTVTSSDPKFSGKVVVQASATHTGVVTTPGGLTVPNSISLPEDHVIEVMVTGTTPVKAALLMKGVLVGDTTFTFSASATGTDLNDAMQTGLSVKPVQNPVTVATSFAVHVSEDHAELGSSHRQNGTGSGAPNELGWDDGVFFPQALPWSGSLSVAAGVGRYTAVDTLASLLTSPLFETETRLSGATWVSRALLYRAFLNYPGAAGAQQALLTTMWPQIQEQLAAYTTMGLGMRYYTDYTYYGQRPDVFLNSYAVWVAKLLEAKGTPLNSELVMTWHHVLQNELVRLATDARYNQNPPSVYSDFESLAMARLALGTDEEWTASGDAVIAQDLSLARLVANAAKCSTRARAMLALVYLLRDGQVQMPDAVQRLVTDMYSALRVQARTAYISYTGYSDTSTASAQPLGTQGFGLIAMLKGLGLTDGTGRNTANYPLVEKLANYVAQGNANSFGCFWMYNTQDAAIAAFALAQYDQNRGNTQPHLLLTVQSGTHALLSAEFNAVQDPVRTATVGWADLVADPHAAASPEPLEFTAKGRGESSIAVVMEFVPAKVSLDPVYRGVYVEKLIRRVDPLTGKAGGPALQVVEAGALVDVLIQVTTPDTLQQVVLEDLVPAGLEPLDPNVVRAGAAVSTTPVSPYNGDFVWRFWYWWNPFSAQETLSDRVRWSSYYLSAGAHSVSYRAIANTVGVYALPPAKCWVTVQPEVMGLSQGGSFLVSENRIADANVETYLESQGVQPNSISSPKDCLPCGPQQTCNVRTGQCECFDPVRGCGAEPLSPEKPCEGADCNMVPSGQQSSAQSGLSTAATAGIAAGVAILLLLLAICFCARRRQNKSQEYTTANGSPSENNRALKVAQSRARTSSKESPLQDTDVDFEKGSPSVSMRGLRYSELNTTPSGEGRTIQQPQPSQ